MKKTTSRFYLSLIFIPIFTLFLSFKIQAQAGFAVITGATANPDQLIKLYKKTDPLGFVEKEDTFHSDSKGKFIYKVLIKKPQNLYVESGEQLISLWVKPNSSVQIILKDSPAVVSGAMSIYTHYYIEKRLRAEKLQAAQNPSGVQLPEIKLTDDFFKSQDSIAETQIDFLNRYFSGKKSPAKKQFIQKEILSILYDVLFSEIGRYVTNISEIKSFKGKLKNINISTAKYSTLLSMNNRQLMPISEYQYFVENSLLRIGTRKCYDDKKPFSMELMLDNQIEAIDSLAPDPYCNISNKAIILNASIENLKYSGDSKSSSTKEYVEKIYHELAKLEKKDKDHLLAGLKDKLDAFVKDTRFSKGNAAPDFTFVDSSGKIYHLANFKGKKIYIDVWTTWCGPCLALAPDWNKLVTEYASNDSIVFLSVDLDDKKEDWLNYLKKQHINGFVLYGGDGGDKNKFTIDYNIFFFPHYILIDENGKIISYIAPLPNNPDELKELIKSL